MQNKFANNTHADIVVALRQMTGLDHVGTVAHLAANRLDACLEDIERLTGEFAKASEALIRQRMEHNARVTKLLEANNREVERRRKAEAMVRAMEENARVKKLWDHIPYGYAIQTGGTISE